MANIIRAVPVPGSKFQTTHPEFATMGRDELMANMKKARTWRGRKIQGIGHDGQKISKDKCIQQIISKLHNPGWWIECSDKMRSIMKSKGALIFSNEGLLRKLFRDPNLNMIDEFTYSRHCKNGLLIESVFGNPIIP